MEDLTPTDSCVQATLPRSVLVVGAAASGKSSYAEDLSVCVPGSRCYVATMRPYGEDGAAKVARHRSMRAGKGFVTLECYEDLARAVAELPDDERFCVVLLECIGNLVANTLFPLEGPCALTADEAFEQIMCGIEALQERCDHLIVISNDLGCDGGAYSKETIAYIELVGRVNNALAARFDAVAEVVCGIPHYVKGACA